MSWKLEALTQKAALVEVLQEGGLRAEAAGSRARLFCRAAATLKQEGVDAARTARAFFVPGRVEVLGKHTDYGGGRSTVAAVEQGLCLVAVPSAGGRVRVHSVEQGQSVEFVLDPGLKARLGHWSNYPMTAARRLARNFPTCRRGVHIAFAGDLPPAAGMSSSSALIVATCLVLAAFNRLRADPRWARTLAGELELAAYLGTVENGQSFGELEGDRGVGTFGGSEDHTAILCSRAGTLGQFSYCPTRFERRIELPAEHIFALGCSGVVAEKTGRAQALYNRASKQVETIVETWRRATGGGEVYLAAILSGAPGAAEKLRRLLMQVEEAPFGSEELRRRLEHFIAENEEIVGPAGQALEAGDLEGFGRLVARSQQLAEALLQNQVPQTVTLAAQARACGAVAASAFGAGFGGSVWALVARSQAHGFLKAWSEAYRAAFPAARSAFFLSQAGPAAFELPAP